MRRVVAATARAVVSASAARRTFHSLSAIAPRFRAQQAASVRFASSLSETLGNELVAEKAEKGADIDQDLVDVQKHVLKVFKLKEEAGSSYTTLTRKHGEELIEIVFSCTDVEEGSGFDMEQENGEDPQIEEGQGIAFDIKITKGDNQMVISAVASDALTIRNVAYIDGKLKDKDDAYDGPSFDDLDEAVQGAFYEYLTERNIDDDLSFFILASSHHKEQREYENWLEKVQSFTA